MSTAIIIDAGCELPVEFCRQDNVFVLPVGVVFGDKKKFFDYRDPDATSLFFDNYSHFDARNVYSLPPSVDVIRKFLIEHITGQFDQAYMMCLSGKKSALYRFAVEAGRQAISDVKYRKNIVPRLRNLRIMDTRTIFCGQAILAYEALQMVNLLSGIPNRDMYQVLRRLAKRVHVFMLPRDSSYNEARKSRKKGPGVVSLDTPSSDTGDSLPIVSFENEKISTIIRGNGFHDTVGKLFGIVRKAIASGLLVNAVMISYAGNARDVLAMDDYRALENYADEHGVKIHLTIMSIAAGISMGPGAISVAYCG